MAVEANAAGQVVACPHCQQTLQIPGTVAPTPSLPALPTTPPASAGDPTPFRINKQGRNRQRSASGRTSAAVFRVQGTHAVLEVYENKVTIKPKGFDGFIIHGLKGTKEIMFSSIAAIQHKELGTFTSGYLQFTIPGGNENVGGLFDAVKDENTFMFSGKRNNAQVIKIKNYIEAAIMKLRSPQAPAPAPTNSLSDELQKLAELRQQGLLSEAEFQAAKQKLIG